MEAGEAGNDKKTTENNVIEVSEKEKAKTLQEVMDVFSYQKNLIESCCSFQSVEWIFYIFYEFLSCK